MCLLFGRPFLARDGRAHQCPVLLLTGDPARGAGITPQLAEKIAATLKMGQLAYFEDAGHFMHYELQDEQFDRLIDAIKLFLRGL